MVALRSLQEGVRALADAPVVFVGGVLYALVVAPQSALSLAGVPVVPGLLSLVTFFVTPFLVAGVIGMAAEALDGSTALSTLGAVGRDRYLSLLIGNLIEFGITAVLLVVGVVVAVVAVAILGVGVFAVGSGGPAAGALGTVGFLALGLVALVLVLVVAAVFFVIQFYPVAIAYDGADAVDGFRRSYRLVRDNLVPALGFSAVNLLVGLLTSVPILALVLVRAARRGGFAGTGGMGPGTGPGTGPGAGLVGGLFTLPEVLALTAVSVLVTTLLFAFRQTYATAFYRAAA